MSLVSPNRGYPLERIVGNTGTMGGWAELLSQIGVHLDDLRTYAARASDLPGVGKSVTAARSDATELSGAIAPDIAETQLLAQVLTNYATAHDSHAQFANALIEDIEEAHRKWKQSGRAAASAGNAAMAESQGEDKTKIAEAEDAAEDALRTRDLAKEELDELWAAYERHYGHWDEAYDAAVFALVPTTGVALTLQARDFLEDLLAADTPQAVLDLWVSHPGLQEELLQAHPAILGALDGLPATVRVYANKLNAPALIVAAEAELDQADAGSDRAKVLANEIAYLRQVQSGDVQLYLYDRDASRIIEMLGDLSVETQRVITYVPGTFTNLNDFYTAGAQEIGRYMFDNIPGTVAFVYKDGPFPGEDSEKGGINFIRITEANDPDTARGSGEQLARFELGMRTDPQFAGAEHDAFGHSWGLANVTSAEVAGAEYDKVISLSGAGMLPEWEADPDTLYVDLSYRDALQEAQSMDLVWGGNNPREHPGFDHGDYYQGPDDDVLDQVSVGMVGEYPSIYVPPDYGSVLVENHNLIASNSDDNDLALDDMRELVKR